MPSDEDPINISDLPYSPEAVYRNRDDLVPKKLDDLQRRVDSFAREVDAAAPPIDINSLPDVAPATEAEKAKARATQQFSEQLTRTNVQDVVASAQAGSDQFANPFPTSWDKANAVLEGAKRGAMPAIAGLGTSGLALGASRPFINMIPHPGLKIAAQAVTTGVGGIVGGFGAAAVQDAINPLDDQQRALATNPETSPYFTAGAYIPGAASLTYGLGNIRGLAQGAQALRAGTPVPPAATEAAINVGTNIPLALGANYVANSGQINPTQAVGDVLLGVLGQRPNVVGQVPFNAGYGTTSAAWNALARRYPRTTVGQPVIPDIVDTQAIGQPELQRPPGFSEAVWSGLTPEGQARAVREWEISRQAAVDAEIVPPTQQEAAPPSPAAPRQPAPAPAPAAEAPPASGPARQPAPRRKDFENEADYWAAVDKHMESIPGQQPAPAAQAEAPPAPAAETSPAPAQEAPKPLVRPPTVKPHDWDGLNDETKRMLVAEYEDTQAQATSAPAAPAAAGQPPAQPPAKPARKLYRGFGRADKRSVYTESTPGAIFGNEGKYYSFNEEYAKQFGPQIETRDMDAQNPLVITSDDQWRQLAREAGWRFPNPAGSNPEVHEKNVKSMLDLVRSKGHDAISIEIDSTGESETDLLLDVFGDDQVFFLPESSAQAAPSPAKKGQAAVTDEGVAGGKDQWPDPQKVEKYKQMVRKYGPNSSQARQAAAAVDSDYRVSDQESSESAALLERHRRVVAEYGDKSPEATRSYYEMMKPDWERKLTREVRSGRGDGDEANKLRKLIADADAELSASKPVAEDEDFDPAEEGLRPGEDPEDRAELERAWAEEEASKPETTDLQRELSRLRGMQESAEKQLAAMEAKGNGKKPQANKLRKTIEKLGKEIESLQFQEDMTPVNEREEVVEPVGIKFNVHEVKSIYSTRDDGRVTVYGFDSPNAASAAKEEIVGIEVTLGTESATAGESDVEVMINKMGPSGVVQQQKADLLFIGEHSASTIQDVIKHIMGGKMKMAGNTKSKDAIKIAEFLKKNMGAGAPVPSEKPAAGEQLAEGAPAKVSTAEAFVSDADALVLPKPEIVTFKSGTADVTGKRYGNWVISGSGKTYKIFHLPSGRRAVSDIDGRKLAERYVKAFINADGKYLDSGNPEIFNDKTSINNLVRIMDTVFNYNLIPSSKTKGPALEPLPGGRTEARGEAAKPAAVETGAAKPVAATDETAAARVVQEDTPPADAEPEKAAAKVENEIERLVEVGDAQSGKEVYTRVMNTLDELLADSKARSGFKTIEYRGDLKGGDVLVDGVRVAKIDKRGYLIPDGDGVDESGKIVPATEGLSSRLEEMMIAYPKDKTPSGFRDLVVAKVSEALSKSAGGYSKYVVRIPGDGTFKINSDPIAIQGIMRRLKSSGPGLWKNIAGVRSEKPAEAAPARPAAKKTPATPEVAEAAQEKPVATTGDPVADMIGKVEAQRKKVNDLIKQGAGRSDSQRAEERKLIGMEEDLARLIQPKWMTEENRSKKLKMFKEDADKYGSLDQFIDNAMALKPSSGNIKNWGVSDQVWFAVDEETGKPVSMKGTVYGPFGVESGDIARVYIIGSKESPGVFIGFANNYSPQKTRQNAITIVKALLKAEVDGFVDLRPEAFIGKDSDLGPVFTNRTSYYIKDRNISNIRNIVDAAKGLHRGRFMENFDGEKTYFLGPELEPLDQKNPNPSYQVEKDSIVPAEAEVRPVDEGIVEAGALADDVAEIASNGTAQAAKEIAGKNGLQARVRDALEKLSQNPEDADAMAAVAKLADEAESLASEHEDKASSYDDKGMDDPFEERGDLIDGLQELAEGLRGISGATEKPDSPYVIDLNKPPGAVGSKERIEWSERNNLHQYLDGIRKQMNTGAIDEKTAIERAKGLLDKHLAGAGGKTKSQQILENRIAQLKLDMQKGPTAWQRGAKKLEAYQALLAESQQDLASFEVNWQYRMAEIDDAQGGKMGAAVPASALTDLGANVMDIAQLGATAVLADQRVAPGLNPIASNLYLIAEGRQVGTVFAGKGERFIDSPSMRAVAEMFSIRDGNQPGGAEETYYDERDANRRIMKGKLSSAFDPVASAMAGMNDAELAAMDLRLAKMITGEAPIDANTPEGKVAIALKDLADQAHAYAKSAGLTLGKAKDYGIPHSIDISKVEKDQQAFLAAATRAYAVNNPIRAAAIQAQLSRLNKIGQGNTDEVVQLNLELANLSAAKPADQAKAWLDNILSGAEGADVTMGLLMEGAKSSTAADFLQSRTFVPKAREIMREFYKNDPRLAWSRYIDRVTTIGEFARRFGAKGEKWLAMVDKMRADGASELQIQIFKDHVKDALGTLNPMPSPGHALANSLLALSNMAKLKTTALANFLEPMAAATRGDLTAAVTAPVRMMINTIKLLGEMSPEDAARFRDELGRLVEEPEGDIALARAVGLIDALGGHSILENSGYTLDTEGEYMAGGKERSAARVVNSATNRLARAYGIEVTESAKRATTARLAVNRIDGFVDGLEQDSILAQAYENANPGAATNPFSIKAECRMRLRRAGVPDSEMDAFVVSWTNARESGKFVEWLRSDDPMAVMARKAVRMESAQAMVNASRAFNTGGEKGKLISQDHFFGKAAMTFLRYPSTALEQIFRPMFADVGKAVRGGDNDIDLSPYSRFRMLAQALSIPAMMMAAAAYLLMRDLLSGQKDKSALQRTIESYSYTGAAGGKAEFVNKMMRGEVPPVINEIVKTMQNISRAERGKGEKVLVNDAIKYIAQPATQGGLALVLPPPLAVLASRLAGTKTAREQTMDVVMPEEQDPRSTRRVERKDTRSTNR